MQNTSLVFLGSGAVASASLSYLAQHFTIEAVITKSATKADMANLLPDTPVLTADNKIELNNLFAANKFKSRLGVLVDFGIIVDQPVIDYFPLGIINSHFSLLPQLRGADPISFAILSGLPKTGVSLMLIDESLDTGKLLAQKSIAVPADATTPSLTNKLIELSNFLLRRYLPRYFQAQVKARAQPHPSRATYSRKLSKDDGLIDWQKPAEQLEREIRAFIEWPKSRTTLANKEVIITAARVSEAHGQLGKPFVQNKTLGIYCGEGALIIEKLKPAGKQEMSGSDFMRGYLKA